jgi:death-on-curing family protein
MSRPKTLTAQQLAIESGFDLEDVIIELIRLGMDYASDPRVPIRTVDQRAALKAVGLHPASDERKKAFWCDEFGVSPDELDALLKSLGFQSNASSRVIPKGSHAKLQAFALARTKPTVTVPATPAGLIADSVDLPIAPAIEWRAVGQKRAANHLTSDDIRRVHEALEQDAELAADPIFPPGVKNEHLLESACARPHTGGGSESKYPTVEMAAAALVHSLVNNHPFHNGNKRTALVAMLVYLDRNNIWLRDTVSRADLYRWILEVARHRILPADMAYLDRADREVVAMAEWIRRNSRNIERSERPITWRELRALLSRDFGCQIGPRATNGKVTVSRKVRVGSINPLRGFRREVTRTFVLSVAGDGREVGMGTIKSLRTQLELTDNNNVDSAIFYGSAGSPDRFIQKYQRLLRDLARV